MTDPPDIDRVLRRLTDDPAFRAQLQADPQQALAEYHLSDGDLDRVEQRVAADAAAPNAGMATFFTPAVARPWWRAKGFAAALGAVMLVGVGGGALAETTRRSPASDSPTIDSPASVVVDGVGAMTPVAYTACPTNAAGATQLGSFHRGDRVWIVGRDETAAWLQVRNPAGDAVWVPAATVTADNIDALPVVPCDLDARGSAGSALEAGSTVPPGSDVAPETTSPTGSSTTTTATPTSTAPPTTSGPPASTTSTTSGPGDLAGPTIQNLVGTPSQIWEHYAPGGGRCVSQTTSSVSATVTDPSAVAAVELEWTVAGTGGARGTTAMTPSGATWSGVVGPFAWNAEAVPLNGADVSVTIRARDGAGNTSTATTTVHLHSAQECIG